MKRTKKTTKDTTNALRRKAFLFDPQARTEFPMARAFAKKQRGPRQRTRSL